METSSHTLLALQRTAGNAAVAGSIAGGVDDRTLPTNAVVGDREPRVRHTGRSEAGGSIPRSRQGRNRIIWRQPVEIPTPPPPGPAPAAGTAAAAPDFVVLPSQKGSACACLVFIHNDERNAKLTAQLMHRNCAYNLAIITPDDKERESQFPGNGRIDPNELFPRAIVEKCTNDPASCDDFLARKRGATNPALILRFVQMRFFKRIRDCSAGFSLPVLALHNNVMTDTARYRQRVEQERARGGNVDDLRRDIDKSEASRTKVAAMWELLKTRFDPATKKEIEEGSTNIFTWCASRDIGRCHIGDPEQPDRVIWTTNPADFDRLSVTNVNVVLQTAAPRGGKSEKDLSTLFLSLRDAIDRNVLLAIRGDVAVELTDLLRASAYLAKLRTFGAAAEVVEQFGELLDQLTRLAAATRAKAVKVSQLRFVNIETPGIALAKRTDDERVEGFRFILSALQTLGLSCCDAPARAAVETGLRKPPRSQPRGP